MGDDVFAEMVIHRGSVTIEPALVNDFGVRNKKAMQATDCVLVDVIWPDLAEVLQGAA